VKDENKGETPINNENNEDFKMPELDSSPVKEP